ncbi:hypothetical protein WKT02_03265 [Erysipelotrichaceae bacterium HCN-30851]
MKKIMKICLLMFLMLFFTGCDDSYKYNDRIAEIINTDFSEILLFESAQGFGNDEFNIYLISLDEPQSLESFQPIDDNFFELLDHSFLSMLDTEVEANDYPDFDKEAFLEDFSELENDKNTEYLYLEEREDGMKDELLVYNEEMNIGYYFVIVF